MNVINIIQPYWYADMWVFDGRAANPVSVAPCGAGRFAWQRV